LWIPIFLILLNERNGKLVEKLFNDINEGRYIGYTSAICIAEILPPARSMAAF
jgi:hypothetical protein